jgi:hypothetical protein
MGTYINEASRKRQIKATEDKLRCCTNKLAMCFGKLLKRSSETESEVEITRLFLDGLTGWVNQTCIRRDLIYESAKLDLAAFIDEEFAKRRSRSKSKR